jgi:predicted regulator of Ras-like GTPase activity (Roadblock/LC7/MglB family)
MVKEILNRFLILDGVIGAMVIGRQGEIIGSVKSGMEGGHALSTVMSFVMAESERVTHQFGKGKLLSVIIEFDEYILISSPVSDNAFVTIVAKTHSNIGQITFELKKQQEHIAAMI